MKIILKKVKVHNLKGVDLELDPNQLIVFTGVSGSGKSSLAFDTIYAEGQRRYVETLSPYARQFLDQGDDLLEGRAVLERVHVRLGHTCRHPRPVGVPAGRLRVGGASPEGVELLGRDRERLLQGVLKRGAARGPAHLAAPRAGPTGLGHR